MKKSSVFLLLLFCALTCCGATALSDFPWRAGMVLTERQVAEVGLDRCFTASEISDAVFERMQGKSWKAGCSQKRSDLRYLRVLHRNTKGEIQVGELVCHRLIADRLLRIFRKLYDARYRIERMVLIDEYDGDDTRSMEANNTSCFNFRAVAGTRKLSKHSLGLAIDLNPLYNPYITTRNGKRVVQPAKSARYADRSARSNIPVTLIDHNDLAYKLFRAEGFTWGGDWRRSKDYQHFEYRIKN